MEKNAADVKGHFPLRNPGLGALQSQPQYDKTYYSPALIVKSKRYFLGCTNNNVGE